MSMKRRDLAWLAGVLAAALAISCVFSPLAFSPDSRKLLFVTVSRRRGHLSDPHELQAHDLAAGGTKLVYASAGFLGPPAFSPDGSTVAMLETRLFRRPTRPRPLAPTTAPATAPATREAESETRKLFLRLVEMATGASRRIALGRFPPQMGPDRAADGLLLTVPTFNADGTDVFCQLPAETAGGVGWDLHAIDIQAGTRRRIAAGVADAVVSPDGGQIAAWALPPAGATLPASGPAALIDQQKPWLELILLTADGSRRTPLGIFRQPGERPLATWLADGQGLIVWGRTRQAAAQHLLHVPVGRPIRRIPWTGDRPAAPPVALTRGRLLILQRTDLPPQRTETGPASDRAGFRFDLLVLALPKGSAEVLNTGPPQVRRGQLAASPDGKWIAIRESLEGRDRTDLQKSRIRLLDAAGRLVRLFEIEPLTSAEGE